jgi:hypothetical protein
MLPPLAEMDAIIGKGHALLRSGVHGDPGVPQAVSFPIVCCSLGYGDVSIEALVSAPGDWTVRVDDTREVA